MQRQDKTGGYQSYHMYSVIVLQNQLSPPINNLINRMKLCIPICFYSHLVMYEDIKNTVNGLNIKKYKTTCLRCPLEY